MNEQNKKKMKSIAQRSESVQQRATIEKIEEASEDHGNLATKQDTNQDSLFSKQQLNEDSYLTADNSREEDTIQGLDSNQSSK